MLKERYIELRKNMSRRAFPAYRMAVQDTAEQVGRDYPGLRNLALALVRIGWASQVTLQAHEMYTKRYTREVAK